MSTYIIAEAGVNHNGEFEMALKMVDAACDAGVDAIKFQTFKAESLASQRALLADYQKENTSGFNGQLEMLKKLQLEYEDFIKIKKYCDKKGITFLSTPFDFESVDFLNNLVSVFKISSGEITNLPFLKYVAGKGKPIILSTGMSDIDEVREAVDVLKSIKLTLMHCTTSYPCDYKEVNLRAMFTLNKEFSLPVGYSDHTQGIEVAIAAASLGAAAIEKHFTLDCSLPGPDHKASIEPAQLKNMVEAIRNVEKSLGDGVKVILPCEKELVSKIRRSLVAKVAIKKGDVLTEDAVSFKRPATGISPKDMDSVIGKALKNDLNTGDVIRWEDLAV